MSTTFFTLPWGDLFELHSDGQHLTAARFVSKSREAAILENNKIDQVLIKTNQQLTEYFAGDRTEFDLPLAPKGTVFQIKVWQALQTIPYGEVWSYKEVGEALGQPKAVRAIGNANGKNPLPIIVPCHRVVRHNGALGGYTSGIETKKKLLEHEHVAGYF